MPTTMCQHGAPMAMDSTHVHKELVLSQTQLRCKLHHSRQQNAKPASKPVP